MYPSAMPARTPRILIRAVRSTVCVIGALLVTAAAATAAPADLDTGFSTDGIFKTNDFAPNVFGQSVMLDSVYLADGDLLTVGAASSPQQWHLERINADGTMDSGFGGGDGKVTLDIAPTYTASQSPSPVFAYARAVRVDQNGKIVVTGQMGPFFAVARFDSDGSLDTTFNSAGDDPGANYFSIKGQSGQSARAFDLDFTSDNKIVLGGEATDVTTPLGGGSPNWDFAFARINTDGTLDTTLEGDGTALKSMAAGTSESAYTVAVQSDDKIVLAGSAGDPASPFSSGIGLARFTDNGVFDNSFGLRGDGRIFLPGAGGITVRMKQQTDGRFVLVSSSENGYDCEVTRVDEYGQLDLAFADDGSRTVDFDGEGDRCEDLAIDSAGRIVIVGRGFENGETGNPEMLAARLNPDGSFDTAFDLNGTLLLDLSINDDGADSVSINPTNGKIAITGFQDYGNTVTGAVAVLEGGTGTPFVPTLPAPLALDTSYGSGGKVISDLAPATSDQINDTVIQSDGKAVSVGFLRTEYGSLPFLTYQQDIAVVRHNVDGTLDTTFGGGDGIATISANNTYSGDNGNAVTLQSDGKIVVGGTTTLQGAGNEFVIARLNSNGTPDTTFGDGGDGITYHDYNGGYAEGINAVVVLDDDSIIGAGQTDSGGSKYSAFVKYTSSGLLDTTFDGDGVLEAEVSPGIPQDAALDMVLQPDGKLLATGYAESGGKRQLSLVRIDQDGNFDSALNSSPVGREIVTLGAGAATGNAVAIDEDEKIVVAGTTDGGGDNDIFVARLSGVGDLDSSFDSDGFTTRSYDTNSIDDEANDMLIQPDGKIVVTGATDYGVGDDFAAARFDIDGSADATFDGDGGGSTPVGSYADTAYALALMADGRLIASGKISDGNSLDSALVRIGDTPPIPFVPTTSPPAATTTTPTTTTPSAPTVKWKTKISKPKYGSKYKRKKLKTLSGSVSVTGGTVKRVEIALRKVNKKRCYWLKNNKSEFKKSKPKKGKCTKQRWLKTKVKSGKKWSYKLKRSLPKGKYELYARTTTSDGTRDSKFVKKRNFVRFTVR